MNKKLLELLVCPLCKGRLVYKKADKQLICRADKLAYPIRDDMPVLIVEEAKKLNIEDIDNA